MLLVITMHSFQTPTLINAIKLFIYFFRLKINSTTKEGKQSRDCISLDNAVAVFPAISGPFQSFQTYTCVPVLTKTIGEKLNASGANQGAFLQLSCTGEHLLFSGFNTTLFSFIAITSSVQLFTLMMLIQSRCFCTSMSIPLRC